MSQLNRSQLTTDINNKVFTNTSQQVTAQNVNSVLVNLVDSQLNLLTDAGLIGLNSFSPSLSYASGKGVLYFTQSNWALYRANTNVSPGAFNGTQWTKINQTVNNGLTIYNGDIILGGALDFNTTLNGGGTYGLIVNNGYFANGDSNEIPAISSGLIMGVSNELTTNVPTLVFGESNEQSGEKYNVLIGTDHVTDAKVNTTIVSGVSNVLDNIKNSLVIGLNNTIDGGSQSDSTSNIVSGTNITFNGGKLTNSHIIGNTISQTANTINSSIVLGTNLSISRAITNGLLVGNALGLTQSNLSNASIINAPFCPATASQHTLYTGNLALLNQNEGSGALQANITSATSSASYFGKVTMNPSDTQTITAPCHPNDIIMLTLFDSTDTNNYCWLKAQNTGTFTVQCKVNGANVRVYWQIIKSI
jgi:hypothetical protein